MADKQPTKNKAAAATATENATDEKSLVNPGAPAPISLGNDNIDYSQYADDTGHQDFTDQDITLPNILLLQKMSPQVDREADQYIEGAEPGDILSTFNSRVFKPGEAIFIPCYKTRAYDVFRVEDEGNTLIFTRELPIETRAYQYCERVDYPANNKSYLCSVKTGEAVIDTGRIHGLLIDDSVNGRIVPASIKFKTTKIPAFKEFCQMMQLNHAGGRDRLPIYCGAYSIGSKSIPVQDGKNRVYTFTFTFYDRVKSRDLIEFARGFRQSLIEGKKYKVDRSASDPFEDAIDGSASAVDNDPFEGDGVSVASEADSVF